MVTYQQNTTYYMIQAKQGPFQKTLLHSVASGQKRHRAPLTKYCPTATIISLWQMFAIEKL